MERKLAAILAADVVGYSRLMEADEAGTLAALKSHRDQLIDPRISEHHGRIVKLMGDGALVEFASVVDAVACAAAIQDGMAQRNADQSEDRRIEFRIGVHLGDLIVEGDDLYGDGVNVAARLEGLAEPGGICISRQALDQVETKLDFGYEDLGEQQVKNIARPVHAYRVRIGGDAPQAAVAKRHGLSAAQLVVSAAIVMAIVAGAVAAWWQPWKPDREPASLERMSFPLPDRPSIAVLPFDNLSGDPEQEYFADGMADDLITDLSKISGLFVIARNSSFTYKDRPTKVREIAEDLGVRYVLEGSVRRSGTGVRINVQLIDATTGGHVWAERYDGNISDVFALQDKVTDQIVAALSVQITPDERKNLSQAARVDPEAYDLLLRAQSRVMRFSREPIAEARVLYEKAVELDPSFARAHAGLALTHAIDVAFGWTDRVDEATQKALRHARTASALDSSDPQVHFVRAMLHSAQHQLDDAVAEARRAVALDPNYADGHGALGLFLAYNGQPEEGLQAIQTAMRLSPRHGFVYQWVLANVYFVMGRLEEAAANLEQVLERNPAYSPGRLLLIAIYGLLDRVDDAQWEVQEILVAQPNFSVTDEVARSRFQRPEDRARYAEGLRKAGLPDQRAPSLPDKPSIAILPFSNLSGDAEQEYFADGMTEDLITDLARISGLLVIARNSTFAYKGQAPDVRDVARELGVRYVVEGSVRKAGGRIRINAQLIDAETGHHLWAQRYDREATDVFELQDEVRARIVAALRVELTPAEESRLARPLTTSAEAYDYYIRGLRQESFFTRDGNLESRRLFERAIELDPNFAAAMGKLATAHTLAAENGWVPSPEKSMETARALAEKAVALDADLPLAYWAIGRVYSRARLFDGERAIAGLRKAIEIDPNYADAYAMLANVQNLVGRSEEALGHIEKAMRLNPLFPFWYYHVLATSQLMLTRYAVAAENYEKAIERNPNVPWLRRYLIAAYGHLGRIDDASWEIEELAAMGFEITISRARSTSNLAHPASLNRYLEGLRKAGVPE